MTDGHSGRRQRESAFQYYINKILKTMKHIDGAKRINYLTGGPII